MPGNEQPVSVVQAWIVMDEATRDDATALNDEDAGLMPQQITNDLANNLGYGTLVGQFVSPARLLNDTAYARWVPLLGSLPIYVMDSSTLGLT